MSGAHLHTGMTGCCKRYDVTRRLQRRVPPYVTASPFHTTWTWHHYFMLYWEHSHARSDKKLSLQLRPRTMCSFFPVVILSLISSKEPLNANSVRILPSYNLLWYTNRTVSSSIRYCSPFSTSQRLWPLFVGSPARCLGIRVSTTFRTGHQIMLYPFILSRSDCNLR